MDWTEGIQRALDYVEAHLDGPLSYEEVARQAYSSSFNFQRVFTILCGMPLGEYIRSRRLSIAASELLATDVKVIDLALKYGYDTPESFTRAFTRFHGATPSAARSGKGPLKSFARLSLQIVVKGGENMQYKIERRDHFRIIAKTRQVSGEDDISREEIPRFWDECRREGTLQWLIQHRKKDGVLGPNLVGMCLEDTCNKEGFHYSIGAEYAGGEVPSGYQVYDIPAMEWAQFNATGCMPQAIQNLWHRVFAEFFPTSAYRPSGDCDLEVYSDGNMDAPDYRSAIWVAVCPKA